MRPHTYTHLEDRSIH